MTPVSGFLCKYFSVIHYNRLNALIIKTINFRKKYVCGSSADNPRRDCRTVLKYILMNCLNLMDLDKYIGISKTLVNVAFNFRFY